MKDEQGPDKLLMRTMHSGSRFRFRFRLRAEPNDGRIWLSLLLAAGALACGSNEPSSNAPNGGSPGAGGGTAGNSAGTSSSGTGAAAGSARQTGGNGGAVSSAGNAGQTGGGSPAGAGGMGGSAGMAPEPMVPPFPDDANFPYVITNYDEPYRGQVHFTAPMGWLNDANGMWFDGGLYHLSYQAFPYAMDDGPKHWGHASSPDLVHWTHWPIMLDPGVNVPGDAWSGSTVVDTDNTSGLKSGAAPVLVTLYTCTTQGTCVAYSNDHGITWQAYAKNPVAIGGPNADTRDPHVFWHQPSSKWVCALYEEGGGAPGGISFYNSTDLKNWSKVGHIDFGFECPDIYELPVDDVAANSKWVLQDASGAYLLGQFDGKAFTPDSATAEHMDTSGVFYAAQTFARNTFPDARVVQMPWLRGMNGETAPWNQAIGFPLRVQLKTFPNGVRVARTPVAEIEKLYTSSKHFDAQVVSAGQNPFAATTSKVFDLELVLDLAKTTAKTITCKIGDVSFALDLTAQKLFGATLTPINGKLKLRVLRDWAQYEVFGNDGQVVHTDAHAFDPNDASISLTGDGAVAVASADFHTLGRAWPGTAAKSSVIIDDANASVVYTGTWNLATENRYFKASAHYNTSGQAFEVPFTGTRVEWYGLKNTDLGKADVSIDGTVVASGIDCYDARRQNALLFSKAKLTNGAHTLKVVVTGQKNLASSGTALVNDYVIAYVD